MVEKIFVLVLSTLTPFCLRTKVFLLHLSGSERSMRQGYKEERELKFKMFYYV
jgi:hypothetical protein